jgi:hypothetical protein
VTGEERVRAAIAELGDALIALAREQAPAVADGPVELLDVEAFAQRAGIGRSSAWLAVSSGSVRSVKVGGRRVVPASELSRLAAGEAVVPVTPKRRRAPGEQRTAAEGQIPAAVKEARRAPGERPSTA